MKISSLNVDFDEDIQLERGALPGKPLYKESERLLYAVPGRRVLPKSKAVPKKSKENYEMFINPGNDEIIVASTSDEDSGEPIDLVSLIARIPHENFKKIQRAYFKGDVQGYDFDKLIASEVTSAKGNLTNLNTVAQILKSYFEQIDSDPRLRKIPYNPKDPADFRIDKDRGYLAVPEI